VEALLDTLLQKNRLETLIFTIPQAKKFKLAW